MHPAHDHSARPSAVRRRSGRAGLLAAAAALVTCALIATSGGTASARTTSPGRPGPRPAAPAVAGNPSEHEPAPGHTAAAPRAAHRPPKKKPAPIRYAKNNPLALAPMGVYKGNADQSWEPYATSTGANHTLLAKIAERPKALWFGAWTSNDTIAAKVSAYITNATATHPNALVQMTVFRMVPWEAAACKRLPTAAEQASYKQWINSFAGAIGNTRVALILQPDGPFALCAPHASKVPSHLISYAAQKFSALPHTSVYIDAGASDWPEGHPETAATNILIPAGVKYARGFALNSTHFVSTSSDIEYGTKVLTVLAKHGIKNKHFVIDTAQNGKPFTYKQQRGTNFDNSPVCRTKTETRCVTLGIPPTTRVANPRWHLSHADRVLAAAHVDAYLWYGRPWLYMQNDPFVMARALQLARTTPY